MSKNKQKREFGDFQTPEDLSREICRFLYEQGQRPSAILEPTCGRGSLLLSALDRFSSTICAIGIDINSNHIQYLKAQLATRTDVAQVQVRQGDFFDIRWGEILDSLPDPLLIIGNPPWVTSSELAGLNSFNLPQKTNFKGLDGFEAKTGKSNFDISEWMLIHLLEQAKHRQATMAMLCKTGVARKVLAFAWRQGLGIQRPCIYLVDAQKFFGASVDACLFVCDILSSGTQDQTCRVHTAISMDAYETTFGYRNGRMLADIEGYERWKHLEGKDRYRWRSGIKHDCARVMELERHNGVYRNKLGRAYDLESTYVYPMLKSSDIAREDNPQPSKWMLVTQKAVGEDTSPIRHKTPKTWSYLNDHIAYFDRRKSSVYRNRPHFSIFGVGTYSFAPWKVAISGLYKHLHFALVGPYAGKPVVFDDTCYFLPCQSEKEARCLAELLNSDAAREFLQSFIFWDAKRPITIDVLEKLDLFALARELGAEDRLERFGSNEASAAPTHKQLSLFQ